VQRTARGRQQARGQVASRQATNKEADEAAQAIGRWHDRRGDAGQASLNWAFEAWASDVGRGPRDLGPGDPGELARPMRQSNRRRLRVSSNQRRADGGAARREGQPATGTGADRRGLVVSGNAAGSERWALPDSALLRLSVRVAGYVTVRRHRPIARGVCSLSTATPTHASVHRYTHRHTRTRRHTQTHADAGQGALAPIRSLSLPGRPAAYQAASPSSSAASRASRQPLVLAST
jgi:hypothetical protein